MTHQEIIINTQNDMCIRGGLIQLFFLWYAGWILENPGWFDCNLLELPLVTIRRYVDDEHTNRFLSGYT